MEIPSANLWTSGLVFLITGVLALALAFKLPDKRRLWLVIDYASLCMAGFSIFAAIDAVRRQELSWRLPMAEERAQHSIAWTCQNLDWNVEFNRAQIERFTLNGYNTDEEQVTLNWFVAAASLVHTDGLTADSLEKQIHGLPPANRFVNGFDRQLDFLISALRERDTARAAAKLSEISALRLVFAPWLLTAALALRIGKTTADFRRASSAPKSGRMQ